jgi:hypothetical protein
MKTFTISAINSSREFEGNDLDTVITVLSHAATRSFFGFDPSDSQDAINEALSTLVPHVDTVISGNKAMSLKQMPDNFRDAILNAVLEDGAQIEIEYYAAEDDNANEADQKTQGGFDPTANAADDQDAYDPMDETWHVNGHDTGIPLKDAQAGNFAKASAEPVEPPQGTAGPKKHGMVTVSTNGGMVSTKIEIEDGVTTIRTVIYNPVVLNRAGMDETAMSNCMVSLNGDIISPNNIGIRKLHAGDTLDIVPRFASKLGAE